jgi:hypothetical protein
VTDTIVLKPLPADWHHYVVIDGVDVKKLVSMNGRILELD